MVGIEVWTDGNDPNRVAAEKGVQNLDSVADLESSLLCPLGQNVVIGRILASPVKKLNLQCSAEVTDSGGQMVSALPLLSPSKKKKKR
jgi:hypothetical protein